MFTAKAWHDGQQQANQQPQPPPLTAEQRQVLRRVNRLKIVNILLFFPFLVTLGWWVSGTHYIALPLFLLVLILGLMIRNKVVKRRLRRKYNRSYSAR
jgi:Na+/glutamate symporter